MTPQEFAEAHGLTVEEAALVLSRRGRASQEAQPVGRVAQARLALVAAQKRTGVHPVALDGERLEKMYDPDADVGKAEFYSKYTDEGTTEFRKEVVGEFIPRQEDVSQDPEDY